MALLFEEEFEELRLAPLAIGDWEAELGGFKAVAEHLQEKIKTERLDELNKILRKEVNAGNVELMDDLGVVLTLMDHKIGEAIRILKKAIAAGSTAAHYPLGKIYSMQSHDARDENINWNAAVNQLREAIKADRQNAGAWLYLGKALKGLVEEESMQQVLIAYEQYLNAGAPLGQTDEINQFLVGQDPERQRKESLILGQEALADAEYPRSIAAFERAIQLGDKEAHFFLGTAFEAAGNYARALDAYQKAASLGIRPKEVALRLGRTIVNIRSESEILSAGINAIEAQIAAPKEQEKGSGENEELNLLLDKLKKMKRKSKRVKKSK